MSNATSFCGFDQKLKKSSILFSSRLDQSSPECFSQNSFDDAATTSAPSCDLSELYRQEIHEVTNQIDALVANSNDGKKTGLITLSYEYFGKGRVKIMGQKWVAGKLFKTSKHLGLCPEQAELKVVKEIFKLLQAKYFPERHSPNIKSLEKYEHDLLQFCKEINLSEPVFSSYLLEGKYEMTLTVGSQVSHSGPANFMKDARAIAAKDWLQLYGGNWQQVLDLKNCDDQSTGCLLFNWNDQEQDSRTFDGDYVKIIPSPRLDQERKQNLKIGSSLRTLDLGNLGSPTIRDNADVKRSHASIKISSQIETSEEKKIFNLYSHENSSIKIIFLNSTVNKEPRAQLKFKFSKKKDVNNSTSSWLSQEFPGPVVDDNTVVSAHNMKRPYENTNNFPVKRSRKEYNDQVESEESSFRISSSAIESSKSSQIRCKTTALVAPFKLKKAKNIKKRSDIFDYSDDPDVVEIFKREKAEAKKVAKKAKKGSKYLHGVEKMIEFSQIVAISWKKNGKGSQKYCDSEDFETPVKYLRKNSNKDDKYLNGESVDGLVKSTTLLQELKILQDSPYTPPPSPSLMISPIISKKVSLLEESQIEEDVDNDSNEYIPDLDELLKLPEKPTDGSKTKEEILNELDQLIAERHRLHEEEMAQVDADIEAQKQRMADRKLRLKANAKLRNRLETELTEPIIRKMFQDNLQYLKDIWQGKLESSRHKAFHKSIRTRHALNYKIITDPFTDEHLDWMMDDITKVWMNNIRDQMDNNGYVWKVIVSECFIKYYMDFFNFSKEEAMQRISETPLHYKDRLKEFMDSSSEGESDEEIEVAPEGTKVESLQTAVEGISKLKSLPPPSKAESTPS